MVWYTNFMLWFWMSIILFLFFVFYTILIIILAKKTHAMVEFKAWRKGCPISIFFQDSGYAEWKAIPAQTNIIQDDVYGTYIINETGTYVDRRTKTVLIPFDANFAGSINVSAAKLADDLKLILKDERQMEILRKAVMTGQIEETEEIKTLRTSVRFSSIKGMLNAMIPHAITAKLEMMIAQRLKGHSKINVPQLLLIFVVILGAIILGVIIIKSVLGGNTNPVQNTIQSVAQVATPMVQNLPAVNSSTII